MKTATEPLRILGFAVRVRTIRAPVVQTYFAISAAPSAGQSLHAAASALIESTRGRGTGLSASANPHSGRGSRIRGRCPVGPDCIWLVSSLRFWPGRSAHTAPDQQPTNSPVGNAAAALEASVAAPSALAGAVLCEPLLVIGPPLRVRRLRRAQAAMAAGRPGTALPIFVRGLVRVHALGPPHHADGGTLATDPALARHQIDDCAAIDQLGNRLDTYATRPTVTALATPSACPHARTTIVCIERGGLVADFSARQQATISLWLRKIRGHLSVVEPPAADTLRHKRFAGERAWLR
jgi:hypothetical protein